MNKKERDKQIREIETQGLDYFYSTVLWIRRKYGKDAVDELNLALFKNAAGYEIIPDWYVRFNHPKAEIRSLTDHTVCGYDFIWSKDDWRKK